MFIFCLMFKFPINILQFLFKICPIYCFGGGEGLENCSFLNATL